MREGIADVRTHQYPTNRGTAEFRGAVAGYYERRFGVDLDPPSRLRELVGADAVQERCPRERIGHREAEIAERQRTGEAQRVEHGVVGLAGVVEDEEGAHLQSCAECRSLART